MIGDQEEFSQFETNQRMENLIRIGTVFEVDPDAAKVRIETGDVITGWLSWLALFAGVDRDWSAPSVGEQVIILSPSGDLAQGVVLRALYQTAHTAPDSDPDVRKTVYSDGTGITLNKNAQQLTITVSNNEGELIVNAAKVVVNSDDINLGGEGGPKVARIGDRVNVSGGSSAGLWPIVEGSDKVNAL